MVKHFNRVPSLAFFNRASLHGNAISLCYLKPSLNVLWRHDDELNAREQAKSKVWSKNQLLSALKAHSLYHTFFVFTIYITKQLFTDSFIPAPYVDIDDRSFELLCGCKCCTRGVSFTDFQGSSNFFGNDNSPQVIDPRADVGIRPYNINFTNYAVSICNQSQTIPQHLHFFYTML